MKFIVLEQELSKNTIFIYFRQVFQKLWQYKYNNLTTFWHGLLLNIWPCHLTQAKNLSFPLFRILLPIKFQEKSPNFVVLLHP